jgi:outer membrane protein assembly factor BamB
MSKCRVVLGLTVFCAAIPARANDWSELGGNSGQTRESSEISSAEFAPAWHQDLKSGPIVATPVTSGGRIVVAGSNGAVAALNAADGTALWTRALAEGVRATPTISNDRVVVSTMGGALYALGLSDGQVGWQRTFGGQNHSSPQLIAGSSVEPRDTVVVGAGFPSQDVWRFDVATGEPLWQTPKGAIPALVYSTAAVAGSRIVIGMNGGRFQSFDLATGQPSWKLDASGPVYLSSPLVVGDRVYAFPADQGVHLYGVDATTGAPLAGFPVVIPDLAPVPGTQPFGQGPAVSSPMAAGGSIIVQVRRQSMVPSDRAYTVYMREWVVAIDPAAAEVRWQYPLANLVVQNTNDVPELGLCATPVAFSSPNGPLVAVQSSIAGRLVVLDVGTGKERWSAALGAPGRSSPVFSNGQLLVASDDGTLTAFSSKSNHPPAAPTGLEPAGVTELAAAGTVLHWTDATDIDGGPLTYLIHVEENGGADAVIERSTAPGECQATMALDAEKSYVFTVRARDAQGALSPWSGRQSFQVRAGASNLGLGSAGTPPPPAPPSGGEEPPGPGAPAPSEGAPPSGSGGPVPGGSMPAASPAVDSRSAMDGSADGAADGGVADAQDASDADAASADPCTLAQSKVAASHGAVSEEDTAGCAVARAPSFSMPIGLLALIWAARRRASRGGPR